MKKVLRKLNVIMNPILAQISEYSPNLVLYLIRERIDHPFIEAGELYQL
jgi:hypothetical protein